MRGFFPALLLGLLSMMTRCFCATVSVCNEAALDSALSVGGTVLFECDGTISFTSTKIITNNVVLNAAGRNVTLSGGGSTKLFVVNSGARLTLQSLTLAHGFGSHGGAISNNATLYLEGCTVVSNSVVGGPGASAIGGAIYNNRGVVSMNQCSVLYNSCIAGNGTNGVAGDFGTDGQYGGLAWGGAIYSVASGASGVAVFVTNSTFAFNKVRGGNGGDGGFGSLRGGSGSGGGNGLGGAILMDGSLLAIFNSTVASNVMIGGNGGVHGEYFNPNLAHDGQAGHAAGALARTIGVSRMTNVTVAGNFPVAGTNAALGTGSAVASIFGGSSWFVANSIFSCETGSNAAEVYFQGGGNNICSDSSISSTNTQNNIDPQLFRLGSHGGPTLTMVPAPGSPAIDAANTGFATALDQRGLPRQGAADIGAVESQPPLLKSIFSTNGYFRFDVELEDQPVYQAEFANQIDATNWASLGFVSVSNRAARIEDKPPVNESRRFYRLRSL